MSQQQSLRPQRPVRAIASAAIVLGLLAACGGGGGGGATVTQQQAAKVAITPSNAPAVAAEAINAGNATAGLGSYVGTGVVVSANPGPSHAMVNALAQALRVTRQSLASSTAVGVAISQTSSCAGSGSIAISGNVASGSGPTPGDVINLSFIGCVESGTTVNGSLSLTLGQTNSNQTLLVADVVASAFVVSTPLGGGQLDGAMHLSLDETNPSLSTLLLSSSGLTSSRFASGATRSTYTLSAFDYRLDTTVATGSESETYSFTASGNFHGLGNASFDAATTQPVVTPAVASVPTSGAGVITGANGSTLVVTVIPTGLQLAVDSNGDSVTDTTLVKTWAEINAEL